MYVTYVSLVSGELCKVLDLCMDACYVIVNDHKDGDVYEILSDNKASEISLTSMVKQMRCVPNHYTNGISTRVPRVYVKNGKQW